MNRKTILEAAEQAATAQGYTFYTDSDERMRSTVKRLPAVWLTPPKFISMQGRRHGRITYEVTMHAMCDGWKYSPEQRNQSWTRMEEDLVEMFSRISLCDKVAAIDDLTIYFNGNTASAPGEVAATAKAKVVTLF